MGIAPDPVPGIASLLERLRSISRDYSSRIVVGIAGAPGSGKSTLAELLHNALGPELSVVVPMDGFHLAQNVIAGTPLAQRRGAIDTFDGWGYLNLVERLQAPQIQHVFAPIYLRSIEDPIACSIEIAPSVPIVITEGNYLLVDAEPWSSVRALLSETWFIEAEESLRVSRLVDRHIQFGKSPEEARAWVAGSDAANSKFISGFKQRADIIFRW